VSLVEHAACSQTPKALHDWPGGHDDASPHERVEAVAFAQTPWMHLLEQSQSLAQDAPFGCGQ
jgi:hypothetical protein